MSSYITKVVIDSCHAVTHSFEMITPDKILAELNKQISEKRLKQVDVAAQLGITAPRVTEMCKGKRRIQSNEMPILVALLNMNSQSDLGHASIRGTAKIPVMGKVAAGVWLEQSLTDDDDENFIAYDKIAGDAEAQGLFAVVTEGDSMNLAFPPRAVLVCRHVWDGFITIRSGDYVIVERESHELREMTCKRIEIDAKGDFLLFSESSNPKYKEPMQIQRSTDNNYLDVGVNVIGKVVRVVIDFERDR